MKNKRVIILILWSGLVLFSLYWNVTSIKDAPGALLLPVVLGHLSMGFAGFFLIFFYTSLLIKSHETIEHQAISDDLTQIPNRRYFARQIMHEYNQSIRQDTPFSVIMADIDFFKKYNDFYGDEQGDTCLIKVAQAIAGTIQRPIDFCARYGEDVFILGLPDTDKNGAIHITQKIIREIKRLKLEHQSSSVATQVTLSLGVVTEHEEKSDSFKIIGKADQALHLAKNNGRNRYEFYTEPH